MSSTKISLSVSDIKEIIENAGVMATNVEACVKQGLWNLGGKIALQAKRNVQTLVIPKSAGGTTTGRLAGSITLKSSDGKEAGLRSPAAEGDTISAPNPGAGFSVVVGTNLEYARRIEHGFIGKDSLGRTYNQAPKPYLYPALFAHANDLKSEILAVIEKRRALSYFRTIRDQYDTGGSWE